MSKNLMIQENGDAFGKDGPVLLVYDTDSENFKCVAEFEDMGSLLLFCDAYKQSQDKGIEDFVKKNKGRSYSRSEQMNPCPFCGEKFPEVRNTFPGGAYLRCPDCGARTANFYNTVEYVPPSTQKMHMDAVQKAINAWNERTGE